MRNRRILKTLGVLAVAVFALSVIGAASASAAPKFTASATGTLIGSAKTNQVFTTNGGTTTCTSAATEGAIVSTSSPEQEVTVTYGGCTAFGFINVKITPATYLFTANGEVHIKNTITIEPIGAGCTVTVKPQTVKSVAFDNEPTNKITETSTVKAIKYTSTGGLCGSSGENGTYTGNSILERKGGGSVSWDKE
jgi:hypothetical protein